MLWSDGSGNHWFCFWDNMCARFVIVPISCRLLDFRYVQHVNSGDWLDLFLSGQRGSTRNRIGPYYLDPTSQVLVHSIDRSAPFSSTRCVACVVGLICVNAAGAIERIAWPKQGKPGEFRQFLLMLLWFSLFWCGAGPFMLSCGDNRNEKTEFAQRIREAFELILPYNIQSIDSFLYRKSNHSKTIQIVMNLNL